MAKLAYVLAPLLIAGCSTVQVRSTPAPNANLSQLRTFAFMTPVQPSSAAAALDRSPAGQQIRAEVANKLVDKGYTPAAPGQQPDFLVAYRTLLQQKTDVQSYGYPGPWGWGWGWGWGSWAWGGPDVAVRQYTEGTIVVDFVDPLSHNVLWRGTATGVVEHPQNPNLQKVARAVDKLMDRYPTSALAATGRTRM
jgi:hypothetical protein